MQILSPGKTYSFVLDLNGWATIGGAYASAAGLISFVYFNDTVALELFCNGAEDSTSDTFIGASVALATSPAGVAFGITNDRAIVTIPILADTAPGVYNVKLSGNVNTGISFLEFEFTLESFQVGPVSCSTDAMLGTPLTESATGNIANTIKQSADQASGPMRIWMDGLYSRTDPLCLDVLFASSPAPGQTIRYFPYATLNNRTEYYSPEVSEYIGWLSAENTWVASPNSDLSFYTTVGVDFYSGPSGVWGDGRSVTSLLMPFASDMQNADLAALAAYFGSDPDTIIQRLKVLFPQLADTTAATKPAVDPSLDYTITPTPTLPRVAAYDPNDTDNPGTAALATIFPGVELAANPPVLPAVNAQQVGGTDQTGADIGAAVANLDASVSSRATPNDVSPTINFDPTINPTELSDLSVAAIQEGLSTFNPSSDKVQLAATQPSYAPAKAGDKMDLVNAPNATAITAIQSGLSKPGTAQTITPPSDMASQATLTDATNGLSAIKTAAAAASTNTASLPGMIQDAAGGGNQFNAKALSLAPGAGGGGMSLADLVAAGLLVKTSDGPPALYAVTSAAMAQSGLAKPADVHFVVELSPVGGKQ